MDSNKQIEKLIVELSTNPNDPIINFNVGLEYEKLNQIASAISFYLRSVEYGYEIYPLVAYSSLIRISICVEQQQNRDTTVNHLLHQAISFLPQRPEAYFALSKFYERFFDWQKVYTFAVLGLMYSNENTPELPIDSRIFLNYLGKDGLLYQKAVSAWWLGRKNESTEILKSLDNENYLPIEYKEAIKNNLESSK